MLFKVDILGLEDTPKTLQEKTYDYAIKYKIQLKDEQRIYKATDCCSEQNWLLFVSHTDEAMQFLSGNYRDAFGSINMDIFDMIAIVSCAPDLTNSLVPEKKRIEELTKDYFPSLHLVPEHLKYDMEEIIKMHLIDRKELKKMLESFGFSFDINKDYYFMPDVRPEIERTLNILRNEAKKQKKQITIHVRCSTDLIGLEMLSLLPESNGSFDDMVDELAKNNMFNQLMCGKTYKV